MTASEARVGDLAEEAGEMIRRRSAGAGVGFDQIRAFSRHRTLATMLVYRDLHDRTAVQRQLAYVVAATLG